MHPGNSSAYHFQPFIAPLSSPRSYADTKTQHKRARATRKSVRPDRQENGGRSKTLIIAEKPSVAGDIAKALGGFTKHDGYFESEDYLLSYAVGHLLEIAAPTEYEVKRGKWSFAHLPVIPPRF